jgi:NDP-sugar pyrophosphorylase family protein
MKASDVLILCGGLGTRLKSVVPDRPKGLASISGRPFLDILVDELVGQGFGRIIFCAGYGSDQIVEHFSPRADAEFAFSLEERPLGTGGAVRNAFSLLRTDPFAVVNGDSFCRVPYRDLFDFHEKKSALASVVVAPPSERTDVGLAEVAADARVLRFSEKPASGDGKARLVNAGIYVLQRRLLELQPAATAFSLERDMLPQAIQQLGCYGYRVDGPLVDIGTPERYRAAQALLRQLPTKMRS